MSISIDLDEIADNLSRATRYETYVVALCPFHSEHRPSFFVYKDWYRCESCGANGPTNKLLECIGNAPRQPQIGSNFKNPFTRWLRDRPLSETLKLAWKNGPSTYLKGRGIPDEIQRRLGLGILEGWCTFPIRNKEQKISGAIARDAEGRGGQKYVIPYGQDPNLLYVPDWERIDKRTKIYLTFGILDAISIYIIGGAAISTTTGMKMDISYLENIRKRIIFIPDQGEEEAAQKYTSKMGWRGAVMRCNYPPGLKDVSDIFNSEYRDELVKAINIK